MPSFQMCLSNVRDNQYIIDKNQNIFIVLKAVRLCWRPAIRVRIRNDWFEYHLARGLTYLSNIARQEAPLDFKRYKALTILTTIPRCNTNSGPATNQTFSQHGAFKYAFPTLHAMISRSFGAAINQAIGTLSLLTISDKCPPATNRTFLVRSILTSKIIRHFIPWNPTYRDLSCQAIPSHRIQGHFQPYQFPFEWLSTRNWSSTLFQTVRLLVRIGEVLLRICCSFSNNGIWLYQLCGFVFAMSLNPTIWMLVPLVYCWRPRIWQARSDLSP